MLNYDWYSNKNLSRYEYCTRFFTNQARAIRKGEKPLLPEKMKFFLRNLEKLKFVTSFLTKTEIMRELVASYNMERKEVENIWNDFLDLLKFEYVSGFYFDEKLAEIAGNLKLKLRTLINFLHLFIAMSKNVYFVTGDKDMINKLRQHKIYAKVLNYIELRKFISSPPSS